MLTVTTGGGAGVITVSFSDFFSGSFMSRTGGGGPDLRVRIPCDGAGDVLIVSEDPPAPDIPQRGS